MKIYNTLTRKVDNFPFKKGSKIRFFVCGPTVYDDSHIGHARTYVFFDVVARFLNFAGHNVFFLMNLTDIDDKIINRAKEMGVNWKQVSETYTKSFFDNMKSLNVKVTRYAPATKFMKEIIWQVSKLLEKGYAYKTENGIYYNISKFKDYGKLSKQPLAELNAHRIEPDPLKKNISDFSLWKAAKLGEPVWNSSFGKGRPGWHIEDTAIAMHFFGKQYELHGGGEDLIFPHHEAEIAQAEAISGKKPYVRFWMHVSFLKVNGRKMSKSLGNFITIKDILEKYEPEALRLLLLGTHYKKELDYTKNQIEAASRSTERIKNFVYKLKQIDKKGKSKEISKLVEKYHGYFLEALEKDFDTPLALTAVFTFIREINSLIEQEKIGKEDIKKIMAFLKEIDNILGVIPQIKDAKLSNEIKKLVQEREKARKSRDFRKSDEIRIKLKAKGIVVEDTPQGPRVKVEK